MRNRTALPGHKSWKFEALPAHFGYKTQPADTASARSGDRQPSDTIAAMATRGGAGSGFRHDDRRGIRDRRRRDRARRRRARGRARPRSGRARAAQDDEPARPDRGRDRNGQDENASGDRGAALCGRRRRLRRRREGRRLGDRAPRIGRRACEEARARARDRLGACRVSGRVPLARWRRAWVPVRATVSDFGPLLLAKVLGSNQTQEQSLDARLPLRGSKGLPLLDLSDLRALLTFFDSDAGKEELKASAGSLRRRSACCSARS